MSVDAETIGKHFIGELMQNAVDQCATDSEIFAGLDDQTVTYLQNSMERDPSLRATLAQAARFRANPTKQQRRSPDRVYFIQEGAGGPIKIGIATDVVARLNSLQTANPTRLQLLVSMEGNSATERELHSRFSDSRIHGEWFAPTTELLSYIGGIS